MRVNSEFTVARTGSFGVFAPQDDTLTEVRS
jgi:hypothetical protein